MRPSAVSNSSKGRPGRKVTPFIGGLALGLVLAAGIALYITQSPLPFVDRLGTGRPAEGPKPDPTGRVVLPDPNRTILPKDAGQAESSEEAGIETKIVSPSGLTYLLQVGAFRAAGDAEQMRARMAILGFEAQVSGTEREGVVLHRVRLGPYGALEDLNKAKDRLSENGIDSVVIRVNIVESQ